MRGGPSGCGDRFCGEAFQFFPLPWARPLAPRCPSELTRAHGQCLRPWAARSPS